MALVTDTSIIFGSIDNMQKLNIHTIPLKETPRRIVHQEITKVISS